MPEVQTKTVKSLTVMSLSFTGPYEQTGEKVDELIAWILRAGHPYSGPPMGIYYDEPGEVPDEQLRAEVCVPIEETCDGDFEVDRKRLPGCEVAYAVHQGPYDQIKPVYAQIFAWIQENGYTYVKEAGCRELFLTVAGDEEGADELLTEVQVPITKKGEAEGEGEAGGTEA